MATYTSTQDGAWNTDATWGGGGHPSSNDDVAVIGHVVTYDAGVSAITWGNITVNSGGMLIFPIDASSKLLFNTTGVLTVNSGGEIRTGTSGAVGAVDDAYLLQLHWPQGSTDRYVFVQNNGSTINIRGDSAFYGGERYAYLDSNWSSGQAFYVTGDYSSAWKTGQKVYIHTNADYVSNGHQTQGDIYTIASVAAYDSVNDRTEITISESAPGVTYAAVHATTGHLSKIINVSRNVELSNTSAAYDVFSYYSFDERIRFDLNQGPSNNLVDMRECLFFGWDRALDEGNNFSGTNLVFVSNSNSVYAGINHSITGDFVSNSNGVYAGANHSITGDFVSNSNGVYIGINHSITGDFVSNLTGVYSGINHSITGDFVSNLTGVNGGTNHSITGDFVSNSNGVYAGIHHSITGDFVGNVTGVYVGIHHSITGDLSLNTTNVSIADIDEIKSVVLDDCTLSSANRLPFRAYTNAGNFLPLVSGDTGWQSPDSLNTWILQATPNSYCTNIMPTNRMYMSPLRKIASYCTSGSKTLTFKIYPYGWTSSIDQDDLVLEVWYLDSAAGITRTLATNSSQTYANGAWRSCSVTFNPSQDGVLYFNLSLRAYEAGCYVLIDPIWSIA